MTVKKGLLVGVAVGGLLYVMWRRRKGNDAPPPESAVAWEPFTEPVAQPEPVAETESVSEPEPVAEAEPIVEAEPEPIAEVEPEPIAEVAPEPAPERPVAEPVVAEVRHEEPTLTHPGRQHPLTSTGFANRPRPATFSGVGRPQTARTRATWPGVAGAGQQRPKPLRLIPAPSRPASLRRSR
ncbi:MAG TPA: hypothetical protein VGL44_04570 [Gaiellales bacterium]|jgi:hypothetical protein